MSNQNSENQTAFYFSMGIIWSIAIFAAGYITSYYNFRDYLKLGLFPTIENNKIVWSIPESRVK